MSIDPASALLKFGNATSHNYSKLGMNLGRMLVERAGGAGRDLFLTSAYGKYKERE
jgi:hypothetical protein